MYLKTFVFYAHTYISLTSDTVLLAELFIYLSSEKLKYGHGEIIANCLLCMIYYVHIVHPQVASLL